MKNVSVPLLEHLRSDSLTLANLWKLIRTDGLIFGFTDLDEDIVYDDGGGELVYLASTGFTPSSIEATSELAVDNMEIQGVLDSSTITDADLNAGKWDRAEVRVYRVNYKSLASGHEWMNRGYLGEVKTGRNAFQSEIRGLTQSLQQQMARAVLPLCPHMFCDTRCKLNIASNTYGGIVTAVGNRQVFETDLAYPIAFFAKGTIKFLTGDNAGISMDIKFFGGSPTSSNLTQTATVSGGVIAVSIPSGKSFSRDHGVTESTGRLFSLGDTPSSGGTYSVTTGGIYNFNAEDEGKSVTIIYAVSEYIGSTAGQVVLQLEAPYKIQTGDTFTAVAGCDKLITTCKAQFDNVINFGGFPHLPGRDRLITGTS